MNPKYFITGFSTAPNSLNTDDFSKHSLKRCRNPAQNASFGTFGAKIGRLLTPESVCKVS